MIRPAHYAAAAVLALFTLLFVGVLVALDAAPAAPAAAVVPTPEPTPTVTVTATPAPEVVKVPVPGPTVTAAPQVVTVPVPGPTVTATPTPEPPHLHGEVYVVDLWEDGSYRLSDGTEGCVPHAYCDNSDDPTAP